MIGTILWFNDGRRKGCDGASVAGVCVVVDMFLTLSCWLIDLCCIANIMVLTLSILHEVSRFPTVWVMVDSVVDCW